MGNRTKAATVALAMLVVGVLVACGTKGVGSEEAQQSDVGDAAVVEREAADPELTRDDVDCDAEALGEDDEIRFIDAYYVVGGQLGAVCFGDPDPTMEKAWASLAAITPPDQLNDLALFAGFGTDGGEDEAVQGTTLAFVNVIDDEGSAFQMSVNLDAYDEDPEEADLTMAHEFSHVFTSTQSQIDRSPEGTEDCATYFNGEGCYLPDSLMAAWIERFWDSRDLAAVDPDKDVGIDDGEDRCAADPSYLGPYAASTPEEDFAESFSAYVFQVEAPTPEVQAKLDWLGEQPGLAEFRDRAVEAGKGPLAGSFEGCGG